MAEHRNRKVAPVKYSIDQGLAQPLRAVAAADWNLEGAGVTIQIRIATRHLHKRAEVIAIKEAAVGRAVSCDDGDPALQGQREGAWIGVGTADDRHRMFSASVCKQRQPRPRHAFPKLAVARVIAIDV